MAAAPTDESRAVATKARDAPRPDNVNSEEHRDDHQGSTSQSSLAFLTLDQVQNTACEPGKTFGSMNIDELLTNIWTVDKDDGDGVLEGSNGNGGLRPTSPRREDSLSVPGPLGRKTIDEVWSDIRQDQRQSPQEHMQRPQHDQNLGEVPRQPTFGEMTLEDFLIKAGVVGDGGYLSPSPLNQLPLLNQQQNQYGNEMLGYGAPVAGMGYGDRQDPTSRMYRHYHQKKPLLGIGHRADGAACGGGMGNVRGAVRSPASPVSSDGLGGVGGGDAGARKRILEGPGEKVVERRQRRMMKNRESAARSRARKQAYTVELEKELNHLKEENAHLQGEQQRWTARRQKLLQCVAERSETNLQRSAKARRKCCSCAW